jgi:indolepyruvate ferredoxin oxidoreductase
MSLLMPEELVGQTFGITAMGNEGAHWIGMEQFVDTGHVFQNFGDGTYFHSGQLAIQAAIGAGVSITFKILYNSTVAMTGGQDASFALGVPQLCTVLLAQGVKKVIITAPDPKAYSRAGLASEVEVWNRNRIIEAQEKLAAIDGVTVLINDQECAAELRRDRKRGLIPTPMKRIVINHRICEGCGDCGDKSNCLSVQPVDTALGRKTVIHQASCNFDYSCVEGDCPAFMEVESTASAAFTRPSPPVVDDPVPFEVRGTVPIRLAGIGGTGVVTAAQILATAAMFDGWKVAGLDQTGLSQKAGPVVSDLILADRETTTNLVGQGEAVTLVAFDQLVAASDAVIGVCDPSRTSIVASSQRVPTGAMIGHPEVEFPAAAASERLASAGAGLRLTDAAGLAAAVAGEAMANILLLGVAVQAGDIPIRPESVRRAIELNGVAIEDNLAAFEWGRAAVSDPDRADAVLQAHRLATGLDITVRPVPPALSERIRSWRLDADLTAHIEMLTADLVGFQNTKWAERFLGTLTSIVAADESGRLTRAAADSLHKLMAYKDEYEVARLMLLPEARTATSRVGGEEAKVRWLLHPPVLASLGVKRKVRFGAWSRPIFSLLARGKALRGTPLDPFGRFAMRRLERALIPEFEDALAKIADGMRPGRYDEAVRIASLPDQVRGFEELKLRRADIYRRELSLSLNDWESGSPEN